MVLCVTRACTYEEFNVRIAKTLTDSKDASTVALGSGGK